jgi:hypothetical protein
MAFKGGVACGRDLAGPGSKFVPSTAAKPACNSGLQGRRTRVAKVRPRGGQATRGAPRTCGLNKVQNLESSGQTIQLQGLIPLAGLAASGVSIHERRAARPQCCSGAPALHRRRQPRLRRDSTTGSCHVIAICPVTLPGLTASETFRCAWHQQQLARAGQGPLLLAAWAPVRATATSD